MYIAPNSIIRILQNVPLTNSYTDTIHFPKYRVTEQTTYFYSKTKFTLDAQMYQRYAKGKLRIKKRIGDLYGCNYLMFQNTAFDTKWFYAFITKLEYINNEVTEVDYEIDVIQTYWTDWQFANCFIERCHTPTDEPFEHTVEENLPLGDAYVVRGGGGTTTADNQLQHFSMNHLGVMVLATVDPAGAKPVPEIFNGVPMPLYYRSFDLEDASSVSQFESLLDSYIDAGREDAIVTIYLFPWDFRPRTGYPTSKVVKTVNYHGTTGLKNNKCLNFPYHFLRVTNNSGMIHDYHFEDFARTAPDPSTGIATLEFDIAGTSITMPSILCYPKNHRGLVEDFDFGISFADFPEVAFSGDAFKAWWAQAKYAIIGNVAKLSASSAESMVSQGMANDRSLVNSPDRVVQDPSIAGGSTFLTGAYNLAIDSLVASNQKMIQPPDLHGQAIVNSLNVALDRMRFTFMEMTVKNDVLVQIDDFFSRFGYRVNKIEVPNTIARPHWTYIKTCGCSFRDIHAPTNDMQKIEAIFDKGITFWVDGDEVGNYQLDNRPV